jgi:hypothetical protein
MNPQEKDLLPGYFIHTIHDVFVTKKMFYFMYMPAQMRKYNDLKNEFKEKGYAINWNTGMLEKASLCGFGWIGLTHEKGDKKMAEDFIAYEIIGPYSQMRDAYKKIRKDYPSACNFYNVYLTDANITKKEENKTRIIFKIK